MPEMDYSVYGKRPRAFTPGADYTAGEQVVSPNNEIVSAKVAFTAGASFVASDWKGRITTTAAIASPTTPSATYVQAEAQSMKTSVDAIRAALTAAGITL